MILDGKYLDEVSRNLGIQLTPLEINGDFQHFGANGLANATKKPIWLVGKVWEYKGNPYFAIQYGDFRNGSKFNLASYDLKDQTAQFKKAHTSAIKDIEAKAKEEKDKVRQIGIDKYRPRFYACSADSPLSEYLKRKGLSSNYRARNDHRNTLLIPLESLDDELRYTFEGVQMIFRSDENLEWVKRFNTGLVKKGAFTRVTEFDVRKSEFIYLAEGYATACSVYAATGIPTVCAFDSGNLDTVIEKLKKLNAEVKIIIAADDDFQTIINGKQINVGIIKAVACCKKFQNVTYRKPKFSYRTNETDFNDLHLLEGLDTVRDQLKIDRNEFSNVILLGHRGLEEFFYLSTQSKTIVSLSASRHKGEYLQALADEKYWAERWGAMPQPKSDNNDPDYVPPLRPNWNLIRDRLLAKQREIGAFDNKRLRGLGVWREGDRILVNTGQGVYDSSKRVVMSNIDPHLAAKSFYNATSGESINFDDELTDEECLQIANAIKALNYKSEYDYIFVIGFIAVANIFGALDWRPHLWITAPSGSGKSWIIKRLYDLIYFSFYIKRGTLAGVQQMLDNHAKCIVYDEAEASEEIERIVAMAREASTNDGAMVVKGSTGGKVRTSESNACFLFTSIEPPVLNKADDSRFFIVDMGTNESQSVDEFEEIKRQFKAVEGMAPRLLARMVNNLDILEKNMMVVKRALREKGISSREADQLAPILGGYGLMMRKEVLDLDIVHWMIDKMQLTKSDYVERNEDKQEERAYQALMMLNLENGGRTVAFALETLLKANSDVELSILHDLLAGHGMVFDKIARSLFIASNAPLLSRKMKAQGLMNYSKVLGRHTACIKKSHYQRVSWSKSGVRGLVLQY